MSALPEDGCLFELILVLQGGFGMCNSKVFCKFPDLSLL